MNLAAPLPDVPSSSGATAAASRRRSFAISVSAAFVLNLLAIGAFAAATSRWHALAGRALHTSWITAVTVTRASPPPEPAAPAGAAAEKAPLVVPEPAIPALPRAIVAPVAPTASAEAGPMRFYRSSEDDQPAEPDSDWNLDTAALDTAGIERLVFDIFIGRDGEVVACMIVEPAALDADARQTLETRLRETALRPARLGGATVASAQRIEVSVLPGLR